MTKKEFYVGFSDFMADADFSKYSIAQYKKYLNNACKNLPGIQDLMEKIAESDNQRVQEQYAEAINAAITSAQNDENCSISSKDLSDYKSAVAVLIAYISGQQWEKNVGPVCIIPLNANSEYSKKDLKKIFLARLNTQDRFSYDYGVFAARVLTKIAKKYKVKLYDDAINNIKFLYIDDVNKYVKLKDIDKLVIDKNGYVYALVKRKYKFKYFGPYAHYRVYTERYKNGRTHGFERINVRSIADLSLDHEIPMHEALKNEMVNMPEYKKLSDDIMKFKNTHKDLNASELSKEYYNKAYPNLDICEEDMLKEIKTFIDNIQLTIMLRSYNSSKSKN